MGNYLKELIIVFFFQCYETPLYSCMGSKVSSYKLQMENTPKKNYFSFCEKSALQLKSIELNTVCTFSFWLDT